MPTLKFTKMHGLGNDFVIMDAIRQIVRLDKAQIRWIADRHLGIGCDQVLLVEASSESEIDFYYRIFNADGSEVGQCGNGARCLARFVHEAGLTDKTKICVKTATTQLRLQYQNPQQIKVNMSKPTQLESVTVAEQTAISLSLGNPHLVFMVKDCQRIKVAKQGKTWQTNELFAEGVNVGFMQIAGPQLIKLRVYERGAGETLACGSGACAAVVAGIWQGVLQSPVTVQLAHGDLVIAWDGVGEVEMEGPAQKVFEGMIEI